MEDKSENNSENINLENNNNQNNEAKESPFKMITKEQEKEEITEIKKNKDLENYLNENNSTNRSDKHNKNDDEKKISTNSYLSPIQTHPINKDKDNHNKNISTKKNKKKVNLNFLSPDVYMRKKKDHSEPDKNPIEIKLKKIEEIIQNQIDYDYKRTMKEIQGELETNKKNKEQQKHIIEEDQKLKEKLKLMEEFRENKIRERAQRVIKKQNRINKNVEKIKAIEKSNISNIQNDENSNTNRNYDNSQTLESNRSYKNKKKLPPISNTPDRYNYMMSKKLKEKEFIQNTQEIMKTLEAEHKVNYLKQYKKSNEKIKEHNKKYDERNEQYSKFRTEKELEKNKKYLEKDMNNRYNVRLNILRDRSEKSGRLKDYIKKNLDNFLEKKEILEQQEKEKIKKLLKKINKKKNDSNNQINSKSQREYYSDLQKANINKEEKKFEIKYNDYLMQQQDLKNYNCDLQKEDSNNKKYIYRNILEKYNNNEKKYESFHQFLDEAEKKDITKMPDKVKLKLYKKKVKEENEERIRKEEEAQNK